MVFNARAAGISASIASITPQRMPMSRLPRSDWLGSSTSPPLITRSNLSVGPIAASAEPVNRPDRAAAAADPVRLRKLRRENADMVALPRCYFLSMDDAPAAGIAQAAGHGAGALRTSIELLGFDTGSTLGGTQNLNGQFGRWPLALVFSLTLVLRRISGHRGPDRAQMGIDRAVVAGLLAQARPEQGRGT